MSDIADSPPIDARGLNCPLPLLKLRKAVATRPGAPSYTVLATDPDSETDIRKFADREGYTLEVARAADGSLRLRLTRAG